MHETVPEAVENGVTLFDNGGAVIHPITHLGKLRGARPLVIDHGRGCHVWDTDGNRYIDGLAGLWCTSLGWGNDEIAETAAEQLRNLAFGSLFGARSHESAAKLAAKLVEIAPCDVSRVLFGTSGSDANETQIKLIWYYNNAVGRQRKKKIISRRRGYHGSTIMSASLTGLPINQKGFDLPVGGVLHTDCPDFYREGHDGESEEEFSGRLADNLERLILREDPSTIAAFIAEPLLGAGGVVPPPVGYFQKIQEILDRYEILFVDDEVICGFGRTGQLWGADTFGLKPDTLTVGKSLSSGYAPISAAMIPESMYEALAEAGKDLGMFGHGYTYTGHPLGCAIALKSIEIYEREGIYQHVTDITPYFQQQLARFSDHPLVGNTRGAGLIGACEFVRDKLTKASFDPGLGAGQYCVARCQEHGLLVRALGDTIAFCPPLIATEQEIDEIFERFGHALEDTWSWIRKQS